MKYSVKTCHPHFYNQVEETFSTPQIIHCLQLYHGADEYGVAGSWLSDALNTNIHTFEVTVVRQIMFARWRRPSSSSSTACSSTSGGSLAGGTR